MFSTLQLQHFKDFYRRYLYLIGITCPARQKCLRHRHLLITERPRPPVSITLRAALRDLRLSAMRRSVERRAAHAADPSSKASMLMTCVAPQPHETIARFPGTIREGLASRRYAMPGVMVVIHF